MAIFNSPILYLIKKRHQLNFLVVYGGQTFFYFAWVIRLFIFYLFIFGGGGGRGARRLLFLLLVVSFIHIHIKFPIPLSSDQYLPATTPM